MTYSWWIEGVLALSSMKVTLGFARDRRVLPAYYAGFTATCRDEARHVQAGLRFIRELLNDDPGLVRDLHETMRTLLTFANTGSMRVDLGVLGWSAEREKAFRGRQLRKKLNLVGVALPGRRREMIDEMDPVMARSLMAGAPVPSRRTGHEAARTEINEAARPPWSAGGGILELDRAGRGPTQCGWWRVRDLPGQPGRHRAGAARCTAPATRSFLTTRAEAAAALQPRPWLRRTLAPGADVRRLRQCGRSIMYRKSLR